MAPRECKGPRLFVEELSRRGVSLQGSSLVLPEEASHHIKNVLRLSIGDIIEIADPSTGDSYAASISSVAGAVTVTIEEQLPLQLRPATITLMVALCKGQKNELICDWATELGCSQIIFWQASRSIVRLRDKDDVAAKERKFTNAATAAAQQSRQPKPPKVRVSPNLSDALASLGGTGTALKIYCSLEDNPAPLSSIASAERGNNEVVVVIGPEGDLSPEEMGHLRSNGFVPASLGREVLRSELAVVAALATVRALLGSKHQA